MLPWCPTVFLARRPLLGGLVAAPARAEGPSEEDALLLRRAFEALARDPRRPGARDELEDAEEASAFWALETLEKVME